MTIESASLLAADIPIEEEFDLETRVWSFNAAARAKNSIVYANVTLSSVPE